MASDINHVVVIGRLTRDLGERDFAYLASGSARANVSIAVNRSKKQGEQWVDEASFFDITIWGKTAENVRPYLTKGKQIAVDGYLKQDRWENDGQKFSKVAIVAENVQLLGGKNDGGSNGSGTGGYQQQMGYAPPAQRQAYTPPSDTGSANEFPEDIPF